MGLGTDVAGGVGESIFRAMADAVQVSKLRWRLVDESLKRLLWRRRSTWEPWEAEPSLERWEALRKDMSLMQWFLMTRALSIPSH